MACAWPAAGQPYCHTRPWLHSDWAEPKADWYLDQWRYCSVPRIGEPKPCWFSTTWEWPAVGGHIASPGPECTAARQSHSGRQKHRRTREDSPELRKYVRPIHVASAKPWEQPAAGQPAGHTWPWLHSHWAETSRLTENQENQRRQPTTKGIGEANALVLCTDWSQPAAGHPDGHT